MSDAALPAGQQRSDRCIDLETALMRADYAARVAEVVASSFFDHHCAGAPPPRKTSGMTIHEEEADLLLWVIREAADAAAAALDRHVGSPQAHELQAPSADSD